MFRIPLLLLRGATAVLLALPAFGHAMTRCVATPQALVAAFNDAVASTDPIVLIKLREGEYDLADATALPLLGLSRTNQIVEVSGGWTDGACTNHRLGHDTTVLVARSTQKALSYNVQASGGALLYIHDLAISSPDGTVPGNGSCLLGWTAAGNSTTIERVRLTACRGGVQSSSASGELDNKGELVLRDLVVDGGNAEFNGGLGIYTTGSGITRLNHLTVTGNQSRDPASTVNGLALHNSPDASTELANSVTWGNGAGRADLYLAGGNHWLTRVHSGSRDGNAPAGDNTPSTGDPGFIGSGNPRLRPDSILVDSGVANPAGGSGSYDADGRPRVQGAAVDVGAFELSDLLFRNGFDQP
ncbi:choice-of-anchor Q domain-containing protein [Dokdonella sp.]|uniref:choice-of-anchor Q domain-containing protein n=1 Tax=Dokdonella sp. TaxID=2291710 RepID=UPI002F3EB1A1